MNDMTDTGTRNENPVCEIFPLTDDPLTGTTATPAPGVVNQPGLDTHQGTAPVAPPVSSLPVAPGVDYYIFTPYDPASGGPYVYGGTGHGGVVPIGGQIPAQTPLGAVGFQPGAQWVLDLQNYGQQPVHWIPQSNGAVLHRPGGNQGGLRPGHSVLIPKFTYTSIGESSDEDND